MSPLTGLKQALAQTGSYHPQPYIPQTTSNQTVQVTFSTNLPSDNVGRAGGAPILVVDGQNVGFIGGQPVGAAGPVLPTSGAPGDTTFHGSNPGPITFTWPVGSTHTHINQALQCLQTLESLGSL